MIQLINKLTNLIKFIFLCFYKSIKGTIANNGIENAGYLAFLFMLSIFPFLFFLIAIVTLFFPVNLSDQLLTLISYSSDMTFDSLVYSLKPQITKIITTPPNSLLTLAILSAIWTASSIFEALRTIINRSNRVNNSPSYIARRLISIVEFIVIIFFTIIIILFFGIFPSFLEKLTSKLSIGFTYHSLYFEKGTQFIIKIFTFCYAFLLLSFLYYFLPNKKQKFIKILPGVFLVLFVWKWFTNLFKCYIANFSQLNMIYGSIVGIIIALLYFYFCSIIFIFGAEFNYNISNEAVKD